MTIDTTLKIGITAALGLAFITNIVLYIALRRRGVRIELMRSVKPGYLENLYRQTPSMASAFLSIVTFLCTWSKILVISVGIALVVVTSIRK
jgi:hypothetical protein